MENIFIITIPPKIKKLGAPTPSFFEGEKHQDDLFIRNTLREV